MSAWFLEQIVNTDYLIGTIDASESYHDDEFVHSRKILIAPN